MDEQRLPFPIHGTRFTGDGDPQRGAGEAARLLYFANLIAQAAGVPVYRLSRQTPYGQVTASVYGPLAFKTVHSVAEPEEPAPEEEEVTGITRLVWLPEGFVITPRTAGAPDGFGMPPTPDGKGTPGGPLKQVIINRFKDNQYPDAVYRWGMEQAGMKPGAGQVVTGNLFMMDWELDKESGFGIGIVLSADGAGEGEFLPQFDKRWVPNYAEPDSGEWHCHRPELDESESELEALVRQETNLMREEVGMPPLGKPLRGTKGELSQDIAYQIRYSGVSGHDRPAFRVGHEMFFGRVDERAAVIGVAGENLYFEIPADADATFVHSAMHGWRNSPGHYTSIIRDWTDWSEESYAWIDPAITDTGETRPGGAQGVQIFRSTDGMVMPASGVHNDRPPVGTLESTDMFTYIFPRRKPSENMYQPGVTYRGRPIYVTDTTVSADSLRVLSGTTVLEDGAETKLRVMVLLRPQKAKGPAFVVLYEGAAHDYLATKQEVARYQLPFEDAGDVSMPTWSKSGAKAAFCFTTVRPAPFGRMEENNATSSNLPTSFVGQQLHFVEFDGKAFISHGTDSLKVDPSDFGATRRNCSCVGAIRYLPVYDGEALDYVRVRVDSYVRFSDELSEKKVNGSLVFPGGTEIIYSDVYAKTERARGIITALTPVTGFVRHILPFDVSDPASVAYIQYDHPVEPEDAGISARLIIRGQQVKYAPLAYQDGGNSGPRFFGQWAFSWGVGTVFYTLDAFRGNPYRSFVDGAGEFGFNISYRAGLPPSVPFDGMVVSDSNFNAPWPLHIGPYGSYRGPHPSRPYTTDFVLVGPTVLRQGVGFVRNERLWEDEIKTSTAKDYHLVEEFHYASYKGDWIYAGRIENTLGGTGEYRAQGYVSYVGSVDKIVQRSMWLGDDQYYYHSSLDLKAITGLPDLKDNILPIGVL